MTEQIGTEALRAREHRAAAAALADAAEVLRQAERRYESERDWSRVSAARDVHDCAELDARIAERALEDARRERARAEHAALEQRFAEADVEARASTLVAASREELSRYVAIEAELAELGRRMVARVVVQGEAAGRAARLAAELGPGVAPPAAMSVEDARLVVQRAIARARRAAGRDADHHTEDPRLVNGWVEVRSARDWRDPTLPDVAAIDRLLEAAEKGAGNG